MSEWGVEGPTTSIMFMSRHTPASDGRALSVLVDLLLLYGMMDPCQVYRRQVVRRGHIHLENKYLQPFVTIDEVSID
jgi:hypothetical protein